MDNPTYLSLLPRDVKRIVDQNILMNLDYKSFISECQANCPDDIWGEKGIIDFPDFPRINGITNKAKYLRAASKKEFIKLKSIEDLKEKLALELRESDYRHQAKLLDYNGQYGNYYSFNYIISEEEIGQIDLNKNLLQKYIPNKIENWLVFIYNKVEISPTFIIKGQNNNKQIYDWNRTFEMEDFKEDIINEFNNYIEGLKVYDRIIIKR